VSSKKHVVSEQRSEQVVIVARTRYLYLEQLIILARTNLHLISNIKNINGAETIKKERIQKRKQKK
jgi:hypothetical protein